MLTLLKAIGDALGRNMDPSKNAFVNWVDASYKVQNSYFNRTIFQLYIKFLWQYCK